MKKIKKAFTLIELLVVIAIIALLLSILMPALQRAKEAGMRAVCLSNLHQLGLSWTVYADESKGQIVNGGTSPIALSGSEYHWAGVPTWVGWAPGALIAPYQEASSSMSSFGQTPQQQWEEIKIGSLYKYSNNLKSYKCPVGRPGNERTYSIVDSMNGWNWAPWGLIGDFVTKTSQVKGNSGRAVFLDCGEQSYASWSLQPPMATQWIEPAQSRHSDGATFGFADGHSEHWKWTHPNTKMIGKWSLFRYFTASGGAWYYPSTSPGPDPNPDYLRLQRAIWGKSYR
jgi:prepilin-type N-terminal cleavage/methylation domain-containing protein/prepilin-type processing-associated H-X9-DG protein